MTKFFKKYRFKTIEREQVKKYSLYAIGEILLIVIGILIAIEINEKYSNKKDSNQLESYLISLNNDLSLDQTILEDGILMNTIRVEFINEIIEITENQKKYNHELTSQFVSKNNLLLSESFFIPNNSTIKQVELNGHSNLFKNQELQQKVFDYYSYTERIYDNDEISIRLYQHNYVTPQIINSLIRIGLDIDIEDLDQSLLPKYALTKLTNDEGYKTALALKKKITNTQNERYIKMQSMIEKLKSLIDAEIELND